MVYKLISPGDLLRRLNDTSFYLPHDSPSHPPAAPFPVLVAFSYQDGSVIGLLLAEGAFSYYRHLPLSSPLYDNDCQSLS